MILINAWHYPEMILGLDRLSQLINTSHLLQGICNTQKAKNLLLCNLLVVLCLSITVPSSINNQVSLGAGEPLVCKHAFESLLRTFGFSIQSFHGDNGIFTSQVFKEYCKNKGKTISFSGSGIHHQNGAAKRSIQTVVNWARNMLLHAALHPELWD